MSSAHRVSVGTRPYCSHFLCGNASPCRPVPPLSHKSKAFVGALRMSVSKCRFPRTPTKRQRSAFCGKEEASAPKAKVFRRKTEQLRRAPTTRHSVEGFSTQYIRALGQASRLRIDAGDHIGSPLRMSVSKYGFTGRGRTPPLRNPRLSEKGFSTRIIRALGQASRLRATTRRQNTTFFPQKQSFCGNPTMSTKGSRKTPTQCVLWERGDVGAQNEGFS